MSKVALSGNASGTGIFTIASPNGNTDRTLTLPDNTGTILTTATPGVPVNGPAFSAYGTALQAFAPSTYTKIAFNTEEFDTNSNYDTALYRFTPTVAGYYQVNLFCIYPAIPAAVTSLVIIYKNGSAFKTAAQQTNSSNQIVPGVSAVIYLNGSTDYIEGFGIHLNASAVNCGSTSAVTAFSAFLARSAT